MLDSRRWLFACILILLSGCTSHQIYQINRQVVAHGGENACARYRVGSGLPQYDYSSVTVEFTDQGAFYERPQMRCALKHIEKEAVDDNLLIVIFAHGWKHNAESSDENFQSFGKLLEELSFNEAYGTSPGKKPRKIVGVYLGWRGASSKIPFLENLTFWNRKSAAETVGSDSVTELLTSIESIKTSKRTVVRSDFSQPTQMVVIGHSFGGALIYSALSSLLVERFVSSMSQGETRTPSTFGDLIVLVNPAFQAARFRNIHELSIERQYMPRQSPIMLVATSSADTATRILFPIGRALSVALEDRPTDAGEHQDSFALATTAIGHYDPYRTHTLWMNDSITEYCTYVERRSSPQEAKAVRKAVQEFQKNYPIRFGADISPMVSIPAESIRLSSGVLVPEKNGVANNPIIVAQTSKSLIEDHGDIWNCKFTGFLVEFIGQSLNRR